MARSHAGTLPPSCRETCLEGNERPAHELPQPRTARAALAGTSPVDASSGMQRRHRLNRGGDRQLNWALPTPRSPSRVSLGAGAAQHNRPLPLSDFRHRTEGEDTPPPREETATADDDLVGVVSVPLVADVIQPADVRSVAREHPVAPGGGEEAAEFRLCPVAPLVPFTLLHEREE